ncbi:MAG: LuxR C-terminal-related transcriptional regulator [Nakamurella sp.]
MVDPLLDTKFHRPRRRPGGVARPRLTVRLDGGMDAALTLVSAPPGFGKTMLLAEWLALQASDGRAAAWLSLDHRDNDAAVFWTYLVTAVSNAAPGVGEGALAILQSPQPRAEAVLSSLLNDLTAVPNHVVLVLDDYHVIDNREVHDGMTFLLEHLPERLHVVIAARADPVLPLARLRARGELVEIRATDLRFTRDEAAAYFAGAAGSALSPGEVAALERRTEGWIAALQLAALSMQGRDDVGAFIADFAGDDRYIVDYLAEEVLNRQPEDIRRFLMQTSILDRLSAPLCDAVTGRDDGRSMLATLEQRNLFLVALDDRRRWYRYHQLFADVLQSRLLEAGSESVDDLHRRAGRWFEASGEPSEAIRHAMAAGDHQRVADLAERAILGMGRARREATVLGWLEALPDEVVRARPVLLVGFAGSLLMVGRIDGVEDRLRDAELLLDELNRVPAGPGAPLTGVMVAGDAHSRGLPGMIELYRAALALAAGDVPGTVRHAERARELSAADDPLCRAAAAGLSGLAYWSSGDLAGGYTSYAECMAGLYGAGYIADTFGCAVALADIRLTQGRLGEAFRIYQQALERGSEQGGSVTRGTADMYVGLGEIARERGDLPSAANLLQRAEQLGAQSGLPQNPYRWRVVMARIRRAEGDLAGALDLLDEAERLYNGDFFPDVRPIAAIRAAVWVAQGAVDRALGWVADRGLSHADELSYLREFEHITLARVLLARYATDRSETTMAQAAGLLERLLVAGEVGARTGSVIEILVVQARAHQLASDLPAATAALLRALGLAEPEGYVQVFVDEGPALAPVLSAAATPGTNSDHVRRLIRAAGTIGRTVRSARADPRLVAPLSERELDVLRLLGSDLDGPAIARRLVVSLNTVRTHTKSIYAKLGVNNRRSAVRRAIELHLL